MMLNFQQKSVEKNKKTLLIFLFAIYLFYNLANGNFDGKIKSFFYLIYLKSVPK